MAEKRGGPQHVSSPVAPVLRTTTLGSNRVLVTRARQAETFQ